MFKAENNSFWNVAVTKKKPKNAVQEEMPKKAASEKKPEGEKVQRDGCAGCLIVMLRIFLFAVVGLVILLVGSCLIGGDSSTKEDSAHGESTTEEVGEVASDDGKITAGEKSSQEGRPESVKSAADRGTGRPGTDRTYRPLGDFSKTGIIAAYERDGRPELAELARRYPNDFLKKEALELVIFDSPEDMDREYEKWNEARKKEEPDGDKREKLLWYENWNKARREQEQK